MRPPRLENRHRGGKHAVDGDEVKAVGRVADTTRGWKADAVARAARKIDPDNPIEGPARRVARRLGGAEHRHDWRSHRSGQVHGPGVAGDKQIEAAEDRGDVEQSQIGRDIDDTFPRQR